MPKFRVEWIETEERLRFVDVEAPNLKAVEDWWDPNTIGDLESADDGCIDFTRHFSAATPLPDTAEIRVTIHTKTTPKRKNA